MTKRREDEEADPGSPEADWQAEGGALPEGPQSEQPGRRTPKEPPAERQEP